MVELDIIAKRYGVLPSDVAKLSAEDFQLNLLTISTGTSEEAKHIKKGKHGKN